MNFSANYESEQNILIKTLVEHYKIYFDFQQKKKDDVKVVTQIKIDDSKKKEILVYEKENKKLKEQLEYYEYSLNETRNSFTYKIGRALTVIPRLIRHLIKKTPM